MVRLQTADATETDQEAQVVIDVTGTAGRDQWLGPGDAPALSAADSEESGAPPFDPRSLTTSVPHLFILGARSSPEGAAFPFTKGLQQIRALFRVIGGREELDLYESVQNLLP
jgi:hypothetical protein